MMREISYGNKKNLNEAKEKEDRANDVLTLNSKTNAIHRNKRGVVVSDSAELMNVTPKRKSFLNYEPQFIRVLIISEPNEVLLSLKLLTQVSYTTYILLLKSVHFKITVAQTFCSKL